MKSKIELYVSQKVKELTGIQTDMDELSFIETVLKDHHYLTKA